MPLIKVSEDDLLAQVMEDVLGDRSIGWLRTCDVAKLEGTTANNVRKMRASIGGRPPLVQGWRQVEGVGLRIHARVWLKSWVERGASLADIVATKTAKAA